MLPPGLFCTAVNPLTLLVERTRDGAVEFTLPETLTPCVAANPPPEWVIEPETDPTGAAAEIRAYRVVLANVVPEGLSERLFVNVLLFWLIS